jgi:hypothetical protein
MAEWIAEIRITDENARKLRQKHGLTIAQVREAVALGADDRQVADDDPDYGWRLIVFGADGIGPIVAYLRPIDRSDDLWECLTARRLPK